MGREGNRDGVTIELPADSPLRQLSDAKPTLVVLLRSFNCTFCREALADVAAAKPSIDAAGANVAFVYAESKSEADPWFEKYGLKDVTRISDPTLAHYRAFGLGQTKATSLIDPVVWARGAASALSHGFGAQTVEMMRRAPGVFVVQRDRILAEYRHRTPADRPDYLALLASVKTLIQ